MSDGFDQDATIRALREGERVFGRYVLKRILGRGGMGVVWLAEDQDLEVEVALKFLPELVLADEAAVYELKQETRRSRELTHPNIVRIHDFVQEPLRAAIAMEWVEGETLTQARMKRADKVFSAEELGPWLAQLASALDYAHGVKRVVHRDLKPANVMVEAKTGTLKVMDFGISATLSDTATRVSKVASSSGSPPYMSPQQMLGERSSVKDDVYALGATVYELLTGRPPFFSGNIFAQAQSKVPPRMGERRADLWGEEQAAKWAVIPESWEEAVAACLAKEAEARPGSVGEAVARFLQGEPKGGPAVVAPKVAGGRSGEAAVGGASQPAGKGRRLAALLTVLVLGLVAVGYHYGVLAPEQVRQGEARQAAAEILAAEEAEVARQEAEVVALARVEEEARAKQAEEAEAVRREQEEEAAFARWLAGLAALPPGESRVRLERYLEESPERYREAAAEKWAEAEAGWEAARLDAARGSVAVDTVPSRAEVTVGTEWVGSSPLRQGQVRLGRHPVTVTLPGYEEYRGEIEVKESELTRLEVALVRSWGSVALGSEPEGLGFVLTGPEDTRRSGMTPVELADLPTGDYTLTVSRPGFSDWVERVRVERNQTAVVAPALVGGWVEVTSSPSGATVLDETGREVGTTPLTLAERPEGEVRYTLVFTGHATTAVAGTVKAREVVRLNATLERIFRPVPGRSWTVPGVGMELMPIPAGRFVMGSPSRESGRSKDEGPQTTVTISRGFWLGKTEVTQGQWQALMGSNPSRFKGANLPVEWVSWDEAMEYARQLTEREREAGRLPDGFVYTLPTEAQWEYACRAGTTTRYYTGQSEADLERAGRYGANSGGSTRPVGTKVANAWGLFDMHGNVWEWCLDWYGDYPGGSVTDPRGPMAGSGRVNRGGSWGNSAVSCRSAFRSRSGQGYRDNYLGFRLALSAGW